MVLFRRLLGDVLRAERMRRGMTLREVSAEARVSLGYISEIERGQKEASSELLASLCGALDVPNPVVLSFLVGGFGAIAIAAHILNRAKWRVCPHCGEDVKKGRTDCKKCGYDFTVGGKPPAESPAPG